MAKSRNKGSPTGSHSASKVSVPSHAPAWPKLKIPVPPNSQPLAKPVKLVFKDESSEEEADGSSPVKGEARMPNAADGADGSSPSSTETVSEYDSAGEAPTKSIEKVGRDNQESNKSKKAKAAASDDAHNDSSSGSETSSEDDTSSDSDEAESTTSTQQAKEHSTPKSSKRRTSISSKEQLKNAVAQKHNENKKKGVKTGVEGNVFNARSPAVTTGTPTKPKSADKPSKKLKDSEPTKAPATAPVPRLRKERSDAPPPSSPTRNSTLPSHDASSIHAAATAGAMPPPPPKWTSPGEGAVKQNPTNTKGTPQPEKRDNSGHRSFSSSMFSKQSSSEPEAGQPDHKVKKPKKSKVKETCPDPVMAEARKQAERLRQLRIQKTANGFETSPVTKPKTESDDSDAEDDGQSNTDDPAAEVSSASSDVKRRGLRMSKKKDDSKKRKGRQGDSTTKSSKKRKQDERDKDDDDALIPTPQNAKKSKKRKRDNKDQERGHETEERARTPKKTRKSADGTEGKESLETTVDQQAGSKKDKKTEETKKKKRKSERQGDKPTPSHKSPKRSSKHDQDREASPHRSSPQDSSMKERTNEERSIGTDNPDTTHLMADFRKLVPSPVLESALAKLNSDNKDICSKRKLQHLQKHARRKRNIPASNLTDYGLDDDVTVLTAAKDMIILLFGTRVGADAGSGGGSDALGSRATNMSAMELELSRIAMERQRENERLREQVGLLQARIQRLSK